MAFVLFGVVFAVVCLMFVVFGCLLLIGAAVILVFSFDTVKSGLACWLAAVVSFFLAWFFGELSGFIFFRGVELNGV